MDNPLWQFSLRYYRAEGVAALYVDLQDHYGLNVNLLLWVQWLAEQGVEIDETCIVQAQQQIKYIHESYVQPLRKIRRLQCKTQRQEQPSPVLKEALLAAELLAEQQVQERLYQLSQPLLASITLPATPPAAVAPDHNLNCYLTFHSAQHELPKLMRCVQQYSAGA